MSVTSVTLGDDSDVDANQIQNEDNPIVRPSGTGRMQWAEASRKHYALMESILPSTKAVPAPEGDVEAATAVSLAFGRDCFVALGGHVRGSLKSPARKRAAGLGRCCKQGATALASPTAIVA